MSEPDDATFIAQRFVAGESAETIQSLLNSSTAWSAKPASKPFERVAIKYRAETMVLAEWFGELFPDDLHVFQYRDGVSWMRTIFRSWPADLDVYDPERNRQVQAGWSRSIPLVSQYASEETPLNPVQTRILAWCECMERYLTLSEGGARTVALRYEDLASQGESLLRAFFDEAGIKDVDWEAVRRALGEDSQAGTVYDREKRRAHQNPLTPELERDTVEMIAKRHRLRTPDVVVPHTLKPIQNQGRAEERPFI
jgi:hypothetical protein